jgi:outer membrane protein OmpA-like peptidoglycan-associated protein
MNPTPLWLAAAVTLAVAACSTAPPVNNDLMAAREAVAQVRANPAAARSAAVELTRAQQALSRAETAWANNRDKQETQHLAYLAKNRADIAQAVATQAQADERVQQASAERDKVRLEARTREVEAANNTARTAQANASTSQEQAALERQRAAALERDLQSLQARPTERGLVVTLGDVLFRTGRADLQAGARRTAQQLAQVLTQYPERRVLVEGFTDSQGSEAMNLDLSQRRAEAFRNALVQANVPAEKIEVMGHGESFAVADNNTSAGRQMNRRVEVLFSGADGKFPQR